VNHTVNQYSSDLDWRYIGEHFFTDLPEDIDFDSAYQAQKKIILLDAKIPSYDRLGYTTVDFLLLLEYVILNKRDADYDNMNDIHPYKVWRGVYKDVADTEGIHIDIDVDVDTLRWCSLAYQSQHPPISEWDSCRLDRKFIYSRNLERDINVRVKPSLVAGNEGWVIKRNNGRLIWKDHRDWGEVRADSLVTRTVKNRRKFYATAYRQDHWSTVPARRGIKIAYPLFFQYKGVLYGFSKVIIENRYGNDYEFPYLSKWNGKDWELLINNN
jgi:hypothetical protein